MDDVQFEKNSFINRNRILSKNGPLWLTIPVETQGYKDRSIRDMKVASGKWRYKHLKSIEQTYGKCPFFYEVMPFLTRTLSTAQTYLVDYVNPLLFDLLAYLDITTPIRLASELDIKDRKLGYVISLTQKVHGTHFVFGAMGKEYADEQVLCQANIKACFQDYKHPVYTQHQAPFIRNLSLLDALFMEGKRVRDITLEQNILKSDLEARENEGI
jgi:hypothetical protein